MQHARTAIIAACGLVTTAPAQLTALAQLTSGGKAGERLGAAVALADGRLITGAPGDPEQDVRGVVYVASIETGDVVHTISDPLGQLGAEFGGAVAVDGNTLVIAAPQAGSGRVNVYELSTGTHQHMLLPPIGIKNFGESVAIHADRIVVGAPSDGQSPSAAVVFDAGSGEVIQSLTSRVAEFSQFGASVDVDDQRVIVGDPFLGRAYVFDGDQRLALEYANSTAFGAAVAIEEGVAVVSVNKGAVAFDAASGEQTGVIKFPKGFSNSDGTPLALDQGRVLLGLVNAGSASGVFVFDAEGTLIQSVAEFRSDRNDGFAGAIAMRGNDAAIGAERNYIPRPNSGATHVFDLGPRCKADMALPFGELDLSDFDAFYEAFRAEKASADFAAPFGQFDDADENAFVAMFKSACLRVRRDSPEPDAPNARGP
ncbi:MAG: hypothetical protein AAGI53_02615 [Planctomycetota bacterium]